jgi:hypothetical protein
MLVLPTPEGPTISRVCPGDSLRLRPVQIVCSPWGVDRVSSASDTLPSLLGFLRAHRAGGGMRRKLSNPVCVTSSEQQRV